MERSVISGIDGKDQFTNCYIAEKKHESYIPTQKTRAEPDGFYSIGTKQ